MKFFEVTWIPDKEEPLGGKWRIEKVFAAFVAPVPVERLKEVGKRA